MLRIATIALGILALCVGASEAWADDAVDLRAQIPVGRPQAARPLRHRELTLTLPVWVPGFDGSATIGGVELDVDTGGEAGTGILDELFDVTSELEFALMGAARYRWGRWSVGVDVFHVEVGNAIAFTRNGESTDATLRAAIGQLRLGYRVARCAAPWSRPHCRRFLEHELYVGLRTYYARGETSAQAVEKTRSEKLWADPVVGYVGRLDLSRDWQVFLGGDVGGIGLESDLSWSLMLGITWRPKRWFSVSAAWSCLYVDFSRGVGNDRFALDLLLAGPHLAVSFHL